MMSQAKIAFSSYPISVSVDRRAPLQQYGGADQKGCAGYSPQVDLPSPQLRPVGLVGKRLVSEFLSRRR